VDEGSPEGPARAARRRWVRFVLVGAAILTGVDHAIEASFISEMPDWLVSFATQL
jgi:hypothetical protein